MIIDWTALINLGIALGGFVLALVVYGRNRNKDIANDATTAASLMSEVGYIKANTDDIKRKQDLQDERYIETSNRLTAVEASAKQAHKRIDRLEGREDKEVYS